MANSNLKGKTFIIPDKILSHLRKTLKTFPDSKNVKGFNRLNFLLKNKKCSYEQLKRIKNYFDYLDYEDLDKTEYLLNGGDVFKKWVYDTLNNARYNTNRRKDVIKKYGVETDDLSVTGDDIPKPTIKDTPDIMKIDLMEQINKIKLITKKLEKWQKQ